MPRCCLAQQLLRQTTFDKFIQVVEMQADLKWKWSCTLGLDILISMLNKVKTGNFTSSLNICFIVNGNIAMVSFLPKNKIIF